MEMCDNCRKLNIPEYLFTGKREADNKFNSEKIYRRFKLTGDVSEWKSSTQLSASIFPVQDDSCNREKYSLEPKDVLYNIREEDKGAHYFEWGILSFDSDVIKEFIQTIQNEKTRTFQIKLEHKPEECMYPHCEIHVFENGVKINVNKPKSTKGLIRDFLLDRIKIIKYPD